MHYLQNYEGAITAYSSAIELAPSNARAHNNRARSFNAIAKHYDALEDLNEAIKIEPNDSDYLMNRGNTNRYLNHCRYMRLKPPPLGG